MGIVRFEIIFDRLGKTYSPGEMVTGRVVLNLDAEKKIRGVKLEFEGKGKAEWYETESSTDAEGETESTTVCYQEYETYIKNEQILIGGGTNIDSFTLPPGEHIYPFAIMLPSNAPSSYSGLYGGVSYSAKAEIDIPFALNKTETSDFNVINLLNLNLYPNLSEPQTYVEDKTFCCLWCKSGPLTVVVLLPKTGFAASESIPITFEIDNASNVKVHAVHVYLYRKIHWKANGHNKHEYCELQKFSFSGVEEGQSRTWSENLRIPNTAFPYLGSCSIINISHELHIDAVTSSLHFDLYMQIPITIGHIRLNSDGPFMAHNRGSTPGALFGVPPSQICPSAPPDHDDFC